LALDDKRAVHEEVSGAPSRPTEPASGRVTRAAGAGSGANGSDPAVIVTDGDTVVEPSGRIASLRRNPLVRRVTGYSAGSVVAAFTSELAFAGVYGWLHAGTTWSSLAGFVGGAVPNYILNRRWAWQDRRGRSPRQEIFLYAVVSIASFLVSILVTSAAEHWARHLTTGHNLRVLLVAAAYLAVSGVFFAGKFVAYELLVFTKGPGEPADSASRPVGDATRS
jgi:putative flippase GtrA